MCGITGGWWREAPTQLNQQLQSALHAMRLRGPNDQGYELHPIDNGVVVLGHTRLSIIDLSSGGHQPMYSSDKRYGLVFNGEIYNYRELRQELSSLGFVFHTDSDTEVLLKAWQCWGRDCLTKLVGMFAFVVFDKLAGTLTCVRDPFGIKPFFYTLENGNFLFASEISAIKALKSEKITLDWQRAYDYLVHGDYDSGPRSFVAEVNHLLPGSLIVLDCANGSVTESNVWWQPSVAENKTISFTDATEELREKFLNSVRMHLRSDVPLGAALSGGLDSSAIVCAMHKVEPDLPIHTFSYIAQSSDLSEEVWVDYINQYVGAIPHKITVSPNDLSRNLDDMILAQGEPFGNTSIYAQYCVFKEAKKQGITVTLDGQGADELLAGYHGYPAKRLRSMLDSYQYINSFRFLKNWSSWPGRSFGYGVKQLLAEYVSGDLYDFLQLMNGRKKTPSWLNIDVLIESGVVPVFPRQKPQSECPERRLVSELAFSLTRRGLPSLLRHSDRNSMRFSVESRVPFLTNDIANFLLSLPEHYLISQSGETKSIFRAAMRGIVPDRVLDRRDKIGFATPEKDLLMSMADQIRSWLVVDIKLPFLNQTEILKEFELIVNGERDFSWQVWRWVNFIRWYQLSFLI